MATQLHDTGEKFILENIFESDKAESALPASVDVGLYHETTDLLADSDTDPDNDITTEPAGASYARQTVSLDSTGFSTSQPGGAGTDWQAAIDADVVFDTSDSDQAVDAYFVVVNFDYTDDGVANDHLFWTGDLSQEYNLTDVDQLTLDASQDAVGLSLD